MRVLDRSVDIGGVVRRAFCPSLSGSRIWRTSVDEHHRLSARLTDNFKGLPRLGIHPLAANVGLVVQKIGVVELLRVSLCACKCTESSL